MTQPVARGFVGNCMAGQGSPQALVAVTDSGVPRRLWGHRVAHLRLPAGGTVGRLNRSTLTPVAAKTRLRAHGIAHLPASILPWVGAARTLGGDIAERVQPSGRSTV